MLVGYVSDEAHVAVSGVELLFEGDGERVVTTSDADGAVTADLDPGTYEVTLQKPGYGPKRTTTTVGDGGVDRFRLLSERLVGYISPGWAVAGEESAYYLHAPAEARVSLWRYGRQKERVRVLDWHGEHGARAGTQPLPDGDFTQTGLDWTSKQPAADQHGQTVVAPERSGLYYVHADAADGAFFSFPWVVAPREPAADVAVLAATMTWNAYNNFGGRSNYVNLTHLPLEPTVDPHDDLDRYDPEADVHGPKNHEYRPLSFDRPHPANHVPRDVEATDPIEGRNESHLAPAEWRFLAWLEREGYGYDLYADNQLHDGTLELAAYDALVVHTHPEYWSRRMYERVKRWVYEEGGNLVYLGGNGIDCEVEVVDESRVRYLNHDSAVHRPGDHTESPPDTCESRFGNTVESAGHLLGEVLSDSGIMTAAPYEVRDPDHWVFEGTGLAEGDRFGERSLQERVSGGASGHETDKLSRYAPASTELVAKGTNPEEGGAEMLVFETDAGGAVFSVGSITYTPALLIDETLSTVTGNVLDRFGGGR